MPIEKIITRSVVILSGISLVLSIVFFHSNQAGSLAAFFGLFLTVDFLLPFREKHGERKWKKIVSDVVLGLLIFSLLGYFVTLFLIWRWGPFVKLG